MQTKMCQFQDLDAGFEFFDPVSGEYWVKLNATQAQCTSGGEDGIDCFDPEEEVELVLDEADPGDMDGDFDSAMASAGFGTDEDYGYYGEE